MANKEATVYIVDVGLSMARKSQGRSLSDYDWAMTYIWEEITSTISSERKTAQLGVIGLRTDRTENELSEEDGFNNISVLQEIGQMLVPQMRQVRDLLQVSNTESGDAISAIILAIQMITKHCKKLKWQRKIVLVTNGTGSLDRDQIGEIAKKIKLDEIELLVIGIDFDDLEYNFKEADKDESKATNEQTLRLFADDCGGIFGTMQQAIEELGTPKLKITRPVPSYRGLLTLGDPQQFDSALCIDVERYPRTMVRRPQTASSYVQQVDVSHDRVSAQSSATTQPNATGLDDDLGRSNPNMANVKQARTYQVADEHAPGGKRDVSRDDLAKGYEYGRSAVPISESDHNVTKLETGAGLDIIGFVPWTKFERYTAMSVSCVIIGQKTNTKAIMALSSLIHALLELEVYAVARLVTKTGREPLIILLAPSVEVDYECLLDVQLPFTEDMRAYKFPPLDKIVTVSGKHIKEHRDLPSDALTSAMSDYVDRMDISQVGGDDDRSKNNLEITEHMQMTETYSPVLHRLDQAVRWRSIHPNEPVPPPYEILTRFSNPPEKLIVQHKRELQKLMDIAEVKKVPMKTRSRKRARNEIKPLSGLDVGALLGKKSKRTTISNDNPIPEFRQGLDTAESVEGFATLTKQFAKIIETRIKESFSNINYARALEEIQVMREELIEMEEPNMYNDFVRILKRNLLEEKLGGDRRDFWCELRKGGLGLIDKKTTDRSSVEDDESKTFLSAR